MLLAIACSGDACVAHDAAAHGWSYRLGDGDCGGGACVAPTASPTARIDPLACADSLFAAGDLPAARKEIESYLRHHPNDPRALTLLGRVHLAWPVIGRFKAWRLFERAAKLEPGNPEPRYWQARVGLFLGSADGERLARDGIYKVWEQVATFRDSWNIWDALYRGDKHRRRAVALLARHRGDDTADFWRATMLIELERWREADTILVELATRRPRDPQVWALRAQAAYEAGDGASGLTYYGAALDRAAEDSGDFLWSQVAPIASAEEDSAYHATHLSERATFFRAFWSRREPDLTTDVNERVAEHFSRLREARRQYALLHPLSSFHRSPLRRSLAGALAGTIAIETRNSGFGAGFLPHRGGFQELLETAGLSIDVRDVPEPDSLTRYRRFGLDGRGLVYLRFGKPREVYLAGGFNLGDFESWRYEIDGQSVLIPFARATSSASGFGGDMVVYPTNHRDLQNSVVVLDRDQTSLEATGELHVWLASFRAEERDRQLVYVHGSSDTVAVAVWDERWNEINRFHGPGPSTFVLAPGWFRVGVDARQGDELARLRRPFTVPWLWGDRLKLSSLLVAVGDEVLDRNRAALAMPPTLEFPVAQPLSLYAEIYNLPATPAGVADFEVEYRFEPLDRGQPVTFSFARRAPARPTVIERLVLEPDRVPAGRYRIVLTVRDQLFGVEAQTSRVDIRLVSP